jgi:hypothetical protein
MVRGVLEIVVENLPLAILLPALQLGYRLMVFLLRLHGDTVPEFWISSVVWMDIPLLSLLVWRSFLRGWSSQQVH